MEKKEKDKLLYTLKVTKEEAEYIYCCIHHEDKMKKVVKQINQQVPTF